MIFHHFGDLYGVPSLYRVMYHKIAHELQLSLFAKHSINIRPIFISIFSNIIRKRHNIYMKVGGCMYWDERGVGLNKQVIRSNLGEKGGWVS